MHSPVKASAGGFGFIGQAHCTWPRKGGQGFYPSNRSMITFGNQQLFGGRFTLQVNLKISMKCMYICATAKSTYNSLKTTNFNQVAQKNGSNYGTEKAVIMGQND